MNNFDDLNQVLYQKANPQDFDVSNEWFQLEGSVFSAPDDLEDLESLANAIYEDNGDGYWVDEQGRIHLNDDPQSDEYNMTKVDGNKFGSPSELDELANAIYEDNGDGYWVDEQGRIHLKEEPEYVGPNMTKVDGNIFGANEDQWYNKNPRLFRAEVSAMREHFPKAVYNFLPNSGNMYWLVTLKIHHSLKPWQFMLVYDKDHPHNHGFGGSIRVVPMHPKLDELWDIAEAYHRPGVPHIVGDSDGVVKRYLCTRWPKDISDGSEIVSSACQAAGWAADWAAHFECGIRDKRVWNKWVDDEHFRHLKVK